MMMIVEVIVIKVIIIIKVMVVVINDGISKRSHIIRAQNRFPLRHRLFQ